MWKRPKKNLSPSPASLATAQEIELKQRMARPQRHRLLHGYPIAPLMSSAAESPPPRGLEPQRPLLLGVLPHSFCNPQVEGCGFCTFPHEPYRASAASQTARAVVEEIRQTIEQFPASKGSRVSGLYFGGGTANLISGGDFEELCRQLTESFDFSSAEISFEGVPVYFLKERALLLDLLQQTLPARHHRLSLGVQSFDPERIKQMGRSHFGDAETIQRVVNEAHARKMTVSCDLLVNLPGQNSEQIIEDLDTAISMDFDQICIYHLVLYPGIGTAWSKQPQMLAQLPRPGQSLQQWQKARRHLLTHGYQQTTLTNFEKLSVARSEKAFFYEKASFHPDIYDALGFGPGALSSFWTEGLKTMNQSSSKSYRQSVCQGTSPIDSYFQYSDEDRKLLFITRSLPLMELCKGTYQSLFGSQLANDFASELDALLGQRLLREDELNYTLSEEGMYYADSIAGLLASSRVQQLRSPNSQASRLDRGAAQHHMG